jgi:pimeloyl-ACP methyl ester carboxylesterase
MLKTNFVRVPTNGIQLNVAQAGPVDGPLLIFLHGFPEFWYGWRNQIEHFATLGYRVWAPDQRGYNLSDKPDAISDYTLDTLAGDIVGLIDAAGCARARVVGHDWGAAVTWWLALKHRNRIERAAILNAPHPAVMGRTLTRSFSQLLKSWYMFFFQIPGLPEAVIRRNQYAASARSLVATSRPGTFSQADLDRYVEAWSRTDGLRTMIHWYRAIGQKPSRMGNPRVRVPLLMIWGARDRFLGREVAQPSIALCEDGRLEFIEEASHWVQHEEPARVNALLQEFLA